MALIRGKKKTPQGLAPGFGIAAVAGLSLCFLAPRVAASGMGEVPGQPQSSPLAAMDSLSSMHDGGGSQAMGMSATATTMSVSPTASQASPTAQSENQALPLYVVKSTGINQAAAFDQMHASLNKVNILSQNQISQTPAMTIGEAVQELPGVGVQHDEGEPQFMEIRGMDENLNIITFDGVNVPSYEPSATAVAIDDIPSSIVSNLEIYKTLLPNMDGEGVGGQLNLVPKSALDYPGGLTEITAAGGWSPMLDQPEFQGSLTTAHTWNLGGQTKLGLLFTSEAEEKEFGIEDIEESYSGDAGQAADSAKSINQYSLRDESYSRERGGLGLNVDLAVDPTDKYALNLMYSGYNEWRDPKEVTDYNDIDLLPGDTNSNGTYTIFQTVNTTAGDPIQVEKEMTNVYTENRTFDMDLSGENDLSSRVNGLSLSYKGSYGWASQDEPIDDSYKFENINGTLGGSFAYNNQANSGNSPYINASNLSGATNAANYYLKDIGNGPTWYTTQEMAFQADGKLETDHLFDSDASGLLQFGTKLRMSYATFSDINLEDDANSKNDSGGNDLLLSDVQGADLSSNAAYYGDPGDVFNLGPTVSLGQMQGTNLNQYMKGWTDPDPVGDLAGDWSAWTNIYALYGMYTLTAGNLQLMAGARLEITDIVYDWYSGYSYAGGQLTELPNATPMTGYENYVNVLPGLGMKYDFSPQFQTRLNFSETVARPDYQEYIPAVGQDATIPGTDPDSGNYNNIGNANLQPMISYNFDSSWEYYPQKGAILGLDGFYKEINNYFETDYSLYDSGQAGEVTYANIPWSQVYGLEEQYQQQFTMLPGALSGLGFRGSASEINSWGELTPGDSGSYGQLPSQSNLIWNAGIFYKKYHWIFDIGYSFTGANLYQVGDYARGIPNYYYDNYLELDAKLQYVVNKYLTLYVVGNNLNNAPLRFYQSNPDYPLQDEFYGWSGDSGLKLTF